MALYATYSAIKKKGNCNIYNLDDDQIEHIP